MTARSSDTQHTTHTDYAHIYTAERLQASIHFVRNSNHETPQFHFPERRKAGVREGGFMGIANFWLFPFDTYTYGWL